MGMDPRHRFFVDCRLVLMNQNLMIYITLGNIFQLVLMDFLVSLCFAAQIVFAISMASGLPFRRSAVVAAFKSCGKAHYLFVFLCSLHDLILLFFFQISPLVPAGCRSSAVSLRLHDVCRHPGVRHLLDAGLAEITRGAEPADKTDNCQPDQARNEQRCVHDAILL